MICGTDGCEREVEERMVEIPSGERCWNTLVHTDNGSVECRVGTCDDWHFPHMATFGHYCLGWTPCTATVAKEPAS